MRTTSYLRTLPFALFLILILTGLSGCTKRSGRSSEYQMAITQNGKIVRLYSDGTWEFQNPEKKEVEIRFETGHRGRQLRLLLDVNGQKYDVARWYKPQINDERQITNAEINNVKTDDYEAMAYYSHRGYDVMYYAVREGDKIKIYKEIIDHIAFMSPGEEKSEKELIRVIDLKEVPF